MLLQLDITNCLLEIKIIKEILELKEDLEMSILLKI